MATNSGKIITGLGYVSIGLDAVVSFTKAIKSGVDLHRAITDTMTDVAIGVGTMMVSSAISGAIAGSAVPVVGNLVGFLVGMAVGIGVTILDYYLPQIRQGIKDMVYSASMGILNLFNKINNFFNKIGNFSQMLFS